MLPLVHEISQSALAGAVLTLGVVIMLELRSIARLRRAVDGNLERVFEQLDLLRFESQQLLEAQSPVPSTPRRALNSEPRREPRIERAPAPTPIPTPVARVRAEAPPAPAKDLVPAAELGTGEARLLASLTAARAKRQAAGGGLSQVV